MNLGDILPAPALWTRRLYGGFDLTVEGLLQFEA